MVATSVRLSLRTNPKHVVVAVARRVAPKAVKGVRGVVLPVVAVPMLRASRKKAGVNDAAAVEKEIS